MVWNDLDDINHYSIYNNVQTSLIVLIAFL